MSKQNLVSFVLLFVIIVLVACGPATASTIAPQTGQTPSPISSEQIFSLTKLSVLTSDMETQAAISPKNSATVTAIMATKFAARTQTVGTMTAMPTETPTPAIPSDSPYCTPADLKTSYDLTGGTGNVFMTAVFTNINKTPCYLQALPQAILIDALGKPLDVDYSYQDMSADQVASALANKIGLFPQWHAWFTLIWFDYRTWCGAPVASNLVIRIQLMDNVGVIDIPSNFRPAVSRCDPPGARTSVNITKFELILPPTATPTAIPTQEKISSFTQIKMFDENHGRLIGGYDYVSRRVFHTDDGGLTWEDVTPSSIAYVGEGVFFLDSQNAWIPSVTAGTNIPTIYHTTDGGKSWWQYQHLPFKKASLDFANLNTGWAFADPDTGAGNIYFTMYQTTDSGASWTQLMFASKLHPPEPNIPPRTFHITSGEGFKFLNPSTIWFGGNQVVDMRNVVLQVSRDAGRTWIQKTIEIPESDKIQNGMITYDVPIFITNRDGYVVASYPLPGDVAGKTRDVNALIMTHDGGNTWSVNPTLLDGSSWQLHLQFISVTDGFYKCGAALCVTHNGAQTWTSIPSNFSFASVNDQETLLGYDFVNTRVGWAIVYRNDAYQLIKTTDGGKTWAVLQP